MAKAVRWDLIADPRGFNRGFREANRTADHFARGMKRTTSLVSAAFASIAAVGVVSVLKGTIDKASDLNETVSKTNVIFGKSAKEIRDWSQGSAKSMGLSRQEALASAASFGDMFLQLKLGRKPAVDMSTTMVGLAADFASFHNADITQVLEAQSAAFRGEYDSIQRFIPGITAARVEQVALNQTHKDSAKDLTAAEKATATYSIMLKDASKAQGDFKRTSDGAANQQRILAANIDDLQAKIGQVFLPAFAAAVKFINNSFIPALEKWWKTHGPKVRESFTRLATVLGEVWAKIRDDLLPAFKEVATFVSHDLQPTIDGLTQTWKDNKDAIGGLKQSNDISLDTWKKVAAFLAGIMAKQVERLTTLVGLFARAWSVATKVVNMNVQFMVVTFVSAFRTIVRGAATLAEALHLPIAKGLRKAEQSMGSWVKDFNTNLNKLDDEGVNIKLKSTFTPPKGFSMHSIVGAQEGMRIPGYGGGDRIPIMAEAGEAVVPKEAVRDHDFQAWAAGKRIPGFRFGGVIPHMQTFSPTGMQGTQEGIDRQVAAKTAAGIGRNYKLLMDMMGLGGGSGAGGWQWQMRVLRAQFPGISLISGYRDRYFTATGGHSYHNMGRAVDIPPVMGYFNWIAANYGKNTKELIFSPAGGRQIHNGQHHMYSGITRAQHFNHVHWAYDKGGWLPPGLSLAYNGTGRPERVSPPGKGGGDIHVHLHGDVYGDTNALVAKVRNGIKEAQRHSGVPAREQLR